MELKKQLLTLYRHLDLEKAPHEFDAILKPSTPEHLLRVVSEVAFAASLSETANGAYDDTVMAAVAILLKGIEEDGIVTKACANEAEQALMPLQAAAKAYTVHMVGHAHIDMNWMWAWHETVMITLETFRTMLTLMDEDPEFTFAQSQASCYRIVEQYEPAMLEKIKQRIKEGRWEVSASTWVEADKNMPSSESMARHLLYTKNYLGKLLDIDPATLNFDFEPDTFGHSAMVPAILSKGGVKYYYHCRGAHKQTIRRWRAPTGEEVLLYCEPTWYNAGVYPSLAVQTPTFCAKHGELKDFLWVYGVGDHGGGPTRRDLAIAHKMQKWPIFPTIIFSTYANYFACVEKFRDTFEVVEGELNFIFNGCYTTQSRIKAANRRGEASLGEAEALSAAAKILTGSEYPTAQFEEGWRKILFNQFHDILTGSGVRETREYALGEASGAFAVANTNYAAAMRAISANTDTSMVVENGTDEFSISEGAGVGFGAERFRVQSTGRGGKLTRVFQVFNPSAQTRKEVVSIMVWDWLGNTSRTQVTDTAGNKLAFQWVGKKLEYWSHVHQELLVEVEVPGMGWNCVVLDEVQEAPLSISMADNSFNVHFPDSPYVLENEHLRAEFDVTTGLLNSLRTADGQVLVAPENPAGFVEILEDTDRGMSSWIVGRYFKREMIAKEVRIKQGTAWGELRKSITLEMKFHKNSTLKATISLDKGAKALVFSVDCNWDELGDWRTYIPQLAFAAPYAYASSKTRYDIPAGVLDRDPMDMDLPANSFTVAIPENENASALMLTSDSKYGFRSWNNTMQLTLLRGAFDPDPDPERGKHDFRITLAVTDAKDALVQTQDAQAANRPMPYLCVHKPGAGTLPANGSFVKSEGAYVSAIKWAEDGNSLIVRLSNLAADAACAKLTFAVAPTAASRTNILENEMGEALAIEGNTVSVALAGNDLATVRVNF